MNQHSEHGELRPGAVIIGGDFQGLGILRSLGRRGIPCCIVDNELAIAGLSRYCTHSVRVSNLRDESRTISTLLEIGKELKLAGWVLYPTRDETVAALSRHRERLTAQFKVPTPRWDAVSPAWDKRKTYRLSEKLDIPCPLTWFPESLNDLEAIDVSPPWVIKPAIKENFIYSTKVKAWLASDRTQLEQRFQEAQRIVPLGEIMVQELIPGGSERMFGFCSFFKEGRSQATMVTRYRRQHPPLFGRSCTAVETVDCLEVEELGEKFLKAIDYYGLTEIEFKLDPRDGRYKLLDVNARTWGYHNLGSAAGVDFPFYLYEDQCGRPLPGAIRTRKGVNWIRLVTDIPVGFMGILRRQFSLRDYWRSVSRFDIESVHSWQDPLPGLAETALIPYLAWKKGF